MQGLRSAFENTELFSMQSTPSQETPSQAQSQELEMQPTTAASVEEDVWDIWPYCWATAGWENTCLQVEQVREKLTAWKLQRANRRALQQFQRHSWERWEREQRQQECELKLV